MARSPGPADRVEISLRPLVPGVDAEGRLELGDGALDVAAHEERGPQVVMSGRIGRARGDFLAVQIDGRLVPLMPQHHGAEAGPRLAGLGESPLPQKDDGEVGVRQPLQEARELVEGAYSLRADVLRELLQHCTNVKTVRLCLQLGSEASLPWAAKLDPATLPTGSDRPWVSRSSDGLLVLKP